MPIRAESGLEQLNRHNSNTATGVEQAVSNAEAGIEPVVETSMRGSAGIMQRALKADRDSQGGLSVVPIMLAGMGEIFALAGAGDTIRENPLILAAAAVGTMTILAAYAKYLTVIENQQAK